MPELDSSLTSTVSAHFSPDVLQAIVAANVPGLGAGPVNPAIKNVLEADASLTSDSTAISSDHQSALRSALWLLAGDLGRSHQISQDLSTPLGSFWHGVMHRREADYHNAKYWFYKCPKLGFFERLKTLVDNDPLASPLARGTTWDPFEFVDQCQKGAKKHGELEQQCIRAQWLEWQVAVVSLFG